MLILKNKKMNCRYYECLKKRMLFLFFIASFMIEPNLCFADLQLNIGSKGINAGGDVTLDHKRIINNITNNYYPPSRSTLKSAKRDFRKTKSSDGVEWYIKGAEYYNQNRYNQAYYSYLKSANEGCAEAQFYLGGMYQNGVSNCQKRYTSI